ncbi:MAG: phospholipase D-like domain-containing protein [Proteobacteria bacterium]|nr:phospholipase D-like domain-containing protein [Pseudomonadota bacterium]
MLSILIIASHSTFSCRSLSTQVENIPAQFSNVESGSSETVPESSDSISPPFAFGRHSDIDWEVRFNNPVCTHSGKPTTWCDDSDREKAAKDSGIEDKLIEQLQSPLTAKIRLSYMTLSSKRIIQELCEQAKSRQLAIDIFIQKDLIFPPEAATGGYKDLIQCSVSNPSLRRGVSLHFDNWLFFKAPKAAPIAHANICFFDALEKMTNPSGNIDKAVFTKLFDACIITNPQSQSNELQFVATPTPASMDSPYSLLLKEISNAKTNIKIAAHKITATNSGSFKIVDALIEKLKSGTEFQISIIFDDDTILKHKKVAGSESLNVSKEELEGYTRLIEAGAKIKFVDTNESAGLLMHSKYMIFDEQRIFTGAGNFSSASLLGKNTENFYVSSIPSLVNAYVKQWHNLNSRGLEESEFK